MGRTLDLFAACAPGLEGVVEAELEGLGLGVGSTAGGAESVGLVRSGGGIAWRGGWDDVVRGNLHLRAASRVLVRLGEFGARSFAELERKVGDLDWGLCLDRTSSLDVRVTSRKSRLYHKRGVAERVARVALESVGSPSASSGIRPQRRVGPPPEDAPPAHAEPQRVVVRLLRDRCLISADSSGEHLHRRGYREATAKAPMRETLAAAVLMGAGWRPNDGLVDPLCGSGTIVIEAALIARRIPPGLARVGGGGGAGGGATGGTESRRSRPFAFQRWPVHDRGAFRAAVDEAVRGILPGVPAPIHGSDRDAGAVRAALANAARAGVEGDVSVSEAAVSAAPGVDAAGWIVTNPPYGSRVRGSRDARDLMAVLGRRSVEGGRLRTLVFLSADRTTEAAAGLQLQRLLSTTNGGIPVRLLRGRG